MRNFDNWNRYLDNNNMPLHGCVQFMVKDGNTNAPIYDVDGTALNNPILTDIYGRTQHQVCIDTDVTAYFYSYIGNGDYATELEIDTSDVTKWSLQFTSEDIDSTKITVTSDSVMCIPNMTSLRSLDIDSVPSIASNKVITLLGYNSLGDKEPINYIWNAESTATDNNGSVIKSNDLITGRWLMVQPTEHCDSRHFGVFPSASYNMDDQTYGITQLFNYCNTCNIRPYFNGSADKRWFKYTNLNVSADVVDITDESRFYDLGTSTITAEWNGNPHFVQRNTNVVASNVKTSWNAKTYTSYKNVVLDAYTPQSNWQDANINITYTPCYGYNFNHCVLSNNANIGSDNVNDVHNTFNNCKLNERMFITAGANIANLIGKCTSCQADINDFSNNMWLYKQIRLTSDVNAFLDYRDMLNVGKPIESYATSLSSATVYISNLYNDINTYYALETLNSQITTFNLDNVIGYYNAPINSTVILNNCSVKLKLEANVTLIANNSQIVLTNDNPGANITLRNSTISGDDDTHYVIANFVSYSSVIGINVQAQNSNVKDSTINKQYSIIAEPGTSRDVIYNGSTVVVSHFIHGYFDNNTFNGKFKINGNSAYDMYAATNALVDNLVFINNRSSLASNNAWTITRLGAMNSDALNAYEFTNNKGGFECSLTLTNVPVAIMNIAQSNGQLLLTQDLLHDATSSIIGVYQSASNVSSVYVDDYSKYFTKMRLFVIGQIDAVVNLEFEVIDDPSDGSTDMKIQPNVPYTVAGANRVAYMRTPSTVRARLSTYSKYSNVDNTANFIIPDLAKDPNSTIDEWQIRNFNLGEIGVEPTASETLELSLNIRQI